MRQNVYYLVLFPKAGQGAWGQQPNHRPLESLPVRGYISVITCDIGLWIKKGDRKGWSECVSGGLYKQATSKKNGWG